jgi:hypothetical protein
MLADADAESVEAQFRTKLASLEEEVGDARRRNDTDGEPGGEEA